MSSGTNRAEEGLGNVTNIVLVGKAGNGKSSTANSILGREVFQSGLSLSGVTTTTQSGRTVINGDLFNVIDCPGLFDSYLDSNFIFNEIAKCFTYGIGGDIGVHAFVAVFTVRSRFSEEEVNVLEVLKRLFGEKLCDYLIVCFTGGDELGDKSLEDYMSSCRSSHLTEVLKLCKNRVVLFDNKTNDKEKQQRQVSKLDSFVKQVNTINNGLPYSEGLFAQLKHEREMREGREKAFKVLDKICYVLDGIEFFKNQIMGSFGFR